MTKMKPFDSECHRLASYFLLDRERKPTQAEMIDLAQTIQQAIENWMEEKDRETAGKEEAVWGER